MNRIIITGEKGKTYPLYLTETELEHVYQFMEYRGLEEDFVNRISDNYDQEQNWLHLKYLEDIHELMPWLIQHYHTLYDADLSHNQILDLALDRFYYTIFTPELFLELKALCQTECPDNPCSKKLSNAAEALLIHHTHKCSCDAEAKIRCPAGRYIYKELDILDFINMAE